MLEISTPNNTYTEKIKDKKEITLPNGMTILPENGRLLFPMSDQNEILCPGAKAQTINTKRATWIFSLQPSRRKNILYELQMRSKHPDAQIMVNFGYGNLIKWKP